MMTYKYKPSSRNKDPKLRVSKALASQICNYLGFLSLLKTLFCQQASLVMNFDLFIYFQF